MSFVVGIFHVITLGLIATYGLYFHQKTKAHQFSEYQQLKANGLIEESMGNNMVNEYLKIN